MKFNTELVTQQIWGLVRFMRATTMDAHEANVVATALKNGGGKTIADLCENAGEAGKLMAAVHYVSQIAAERDALNVELEALKAQLAATKEALDFAESARADWSKRYIWLITEVCDALGIDMDNATGFDIVLCVKNLMQRDTRSLQLINVELLAALKTILGINFYGNTVRDGIALTDGGDHFLRNVDASIAKAEETGG